jgi:hypothetical protein
MTREGRRIGLLACLALTATLAGGTTALAEAPFGQTAQAYGPGAQDFWVSVLRFIPEENTGFLQRQTFLYFANGSAFSTFFLAPVELPAGAHVTQMECSFEDLSGTNNLTVGLNKIVYDPIGGVRSLVPITSVSSSGTIGLQDISVSLDETVLYRDGTDRVYWYLSADMPPDTNVRLSGCRFTWNRQVSPPPGQATFGDVATNHQFFQYIEALAASGITAGCGNNNYCPNNPVTRGQMAAFLAKALGLHWPY